MSQTDRYTAANIQAVTGDGAKPAGEGLSTTLLKMAKGAQSHADTYASSSVKSAWARAYKAFQNQHFDGSKYRSEAYRGRSKLFRPKTRSAVRKNEASAAQALFSTVDAVSIKPTSSDMMSTVSGLVLHEIVNHRFDRSSGREGIPWFMVAIGARQNSLITGMCISKQHWQYEEKKAPEEEAPDLVETILNDGDDVRPAYETPKEDQSYLDAPDQPDVGDDYDDDGLPVEEPLEALDPNDRSHIKLDRPWIELIPPENAVLDPAAPWYNPVQEGGYFRARFPLAMHEVRAMMREGSGKMGGGSWKQVDDAALKKNATNWMAKTVRLARDGGREDRYEKMVNAMGDMATVWVTENFFRYEGEDYHFWSIDESHLLSDPIPTEEAYPAFKGIRPYVGGFGAIEAHKVNPMSPVESWSPLQAEANDLANLRLDNIKQHLSPVTKVKRGKQVDLKSVRNRGPDALIMMSDHDDVVFDRPQDVSGSAYQEMNYLNSDFDDLSGSFSGSSVSTNRQLNETVGGMKMLSGSANGMTEYDLRVWSETWVEPAIRQIVQLEQYYEDNPKILALAGERAGLFKKYQMESLNPEMLDSDVLVSVDIGVGAASPEQQAQKLNGAFGMLAGLAQFFDRPVKVNAEETAQVVFGYHGFKDGMRFLTMQEPGEGQDKPSPEEMELQAKQKQHAEELQSRERIEDKKIQASMAEHAMDGRLDLLKAAIGFDLEREISAEERAMATQMGQTPQPAPQAPQAPAQTLPAIPQI